MTVGGLIEALNKFDKNKNIGLSVKCMDEYFEIESLREANEGRVVLLEAEDSDHYDIDFEDYMNRYTGKKYKLYMDERGIYFE